MCELRCILNILFGVNFVLIYDSDIFERDLVK